MDLDYKSRVAKARYEAKKRREVTTPRKGSISEKVTVTKLDPAELYRLMLKDSKYLGRPKRGKSKPLTPEQLASREENRFLHRTANVVVPPSKKDPQANPLPRQHARPWESYEMKSRAQAGRRSLTQPTAAANGL